MRFLILLCVLLGAPVFAQDHTFELVTETGIVGVEPAIGAVVYTNATKVGLLGWEVTVCSAVDATGVVLSDEVMFTSGLPPEFLAQELVPGSGWYAGVVGSLQAPLPNLPPGTTELHRASYEGTTVDTVPVAFCDIGTLPTNTNLVVPVDNTLGITPDLIDSQLEFIEDTTVSGFVRADTNMDGTFSVMDGVDLLNYLFLAGAQPGPCLDASDFDGDGSLNIRDAAGVLFFMFLNTVTPADPYPECGLPDTLFFPCDTPPECP